MPSPAPQSLLTQMELNASSWPQSPLTDVEKQFRKQQGLCNYCGGYDFGTACPKLAQRDAIRVTRFVVKAHEMSILPASITITKAPKNF